MRRIFPIESAVEAFEEALINTAKRCTSKTSYFETIVDMDRKDYKIEQVVTVLDDSDERLKKRLDRYISSYLKLEIYMEHRILKLEMS